MYRQITDALHGRYGTRKQLMAYALVASSTPAYLRPCVRCIERAIQQIPTRQKREILSLHYVTGLSLRQIAQHMALSYRTVCTLQEEALAALEQHLAYEFGNYSITEEITPGARALQTAQDQVASRCRTTLDLAERLKEAEDEENDD